MEKKKILLLDVDEVIVFSGFLPLINEFLHTNYKIDDFTDYYIDDAAIPKERFEEFKAFKQGKSLYKNAEPLPHAIETIKKLNEVYDIYLCSDCIDPFDIEYSGEVFKDKFYLLRKILPFIPPKKFIFTGSKHLFKADIQIDDRINNLNEDVKTKILFPSYHNKDIPEKELQERNILRAGYNWQEGWKETEKILLTRKK